MEIDAGSYNRGYAKRILYGYYYRIETAHDKSQFTPFRPYRRQSFHLNPYQQYNPKWLQRIIHIRDIRSGK